MDVLHNRIHQLHESQRGSGHDQHIPSRRNRDGHAAGTIITDTATVATTSHDTNLTIIRLR